MKNSKLKILFLFAFVGLFPLQIPIAPKDSSETNFRVSGNWGQYAHISRGCEGNVLDKEKIPFREIGFSIDHKTRSPLRLGIHSSYIFTKKASEMVEYYDQYLGYYQKYSKENSPIEIFIVNPFINAEWKNFAIGGGYLGASRSILDGNDDSNEHSFSGYLRIGNPRSVYADALIFHATPVFAGNCFKLGLGFRPKPALGCWVGFGVKPYDRTGLIVKTDMRLKQHLYLETLIRLGNIENIWENAVGLGLTYKLIGGN